MRPLGSGPLGIGQWALVIGIVIGSLAVGYCHCATGGSKTDELICNRVGIGTGPFEGTIVRRSIHQANVMRIGQCCGIEPLALSFGIFD